MSYLPCTRNYSCFTAVRRAFAIWVSWSPRLLGRRISLTYSEQTPSLAQMAASYAKGIVANHPFVDGNKRAAFAVSVTFLRLNGLQLTASKEERVLKFWALAAGEISEDQLADWFARNTAS